MARRIRYTYSKRLFPTIFPHQKGVSMTFGRDRARDQMKSDLGFSPNIVKESDTSSQWVFITEGRATR